MRRVALVYNPVSGQRQQSRARIVAAVCDRLRAAGLEVEAWPTTAPGNAVELAQKAVAAGFDAVLACGGDGTVHEVLQGMADSNVPLGVVPMGTANLLASNLGLGTAPLRAVDRLLAAKVVRVPLGHIAFQDANGEGKARFFISVAGVGPDALFLIRSNGRLKHCFGYARYIVEAFRVWWTHAYPLYDARMGVPGEPDLRSELVSQLLAVRIRKFGPALQNLAPGASLARPLLRLVAFRTRRRRDFLRFFTAVILLRRPCFDGRVRLLDAVSVECLPTPGADQLVYVEADGEVLGTLPARIEMTEQTVGLLAPSGFQF